jgi:hypothetical protein
MIQKILVTFVILAKTFDLVINLTKNYFFFQSTQSSIPPGDIVYYSSVSGKHGESYTLTILFSPLPFLK